MWGRQPSSPRRNIQSLPTSGYSQTLPKLFLHPSTNPNFSGNQFPNSPPSPIRRSFQFNFSNPSSPTLHPPKYFGSTEINPMEFNQQNHRFSLPNNRNLSHKDIYLNMYQSKKVEELSFENGKPYAASFIYNNYRHFLTPAEEKEIRNYSEIFYLRRKPKKRKILKKNKKFKNKIDNAININISEEHETKDGKEFILNEDINNNIKLNETSEKVSTNNQDSNDEFPIGDHIAYRYEILSKIGYGAFGIVLECYDHKESQKVAMKMIKDTHENHPEIVLEAKFLENLQSGCKQHHIIELYESFSFRNYFCISMEFVNPNDEQFRPRLLNSDLLQLFDAVNYIHSNGILHCDIKPSNILFEIENQNKFNLKNKNRNINKTNENKKQLKIIDFGCSCYIGKCPYVKIQSLNYRSPEVVLRLMPYTAAIDIWSIGCVIFESAVGTPLFNSNNERELVKEICDLIGEPPTWMVEESSRASKFFMKIGDQIKIKSNENDDDLIKKNIRSPMNSIMSNNMSGAGDDDDDFANKSIEKNFKIAPPNSKNTNVRKNKFLKNSQKISPLRARISPVGSPLLLSLLEGCLTWDPHDRLTAEQLINHPWSKNVK